MKKLHSLPRKTNKRIAVILAAFLLLLSAFLLAACNDDEINYSADGITVSGRITFNGNPLSGVAVTVGGEHKTSTTADGIYMIKGLNCGDKIAFLSEDYTFTPSEYTVTTEAFDLNSTAKLKNTSTPEEPDNPDPDNPDKEEPDNPDTEEPLPPEEEPSVSNPVNLAFAANYAEAYLTFAAPVNADRINLRLSASDNVCFDGYLDVYPHSSLTTGSLLIDDNEYAIYKLNIIPFLENKTVLTASVYCVYKDKISQTMTVAIRYTPLLSSPENVKLNGEMLSWNAARCGYFDNNASLISYNIYVNGVFAHNTPNLQVRLTELVTSLYPSEFPDETKTIPNGAEITVRAILPDGTYADAAPYVYDNASRLR